VVRDVVRGDTVGWPTGPLLTGWLAGYAIAPNNSFPLNWVGWTEGERRGKGMGDRWREGVWLLGESRTLFLITNQERLR